MTDLEISKALALAIGWNRSDFMFEQYADALFVKAEGAWKLFDYTDWNVIGPIAAKYDCFPYKCYNGTWDVQMCKHILGEDTPQKAIAMTVIEGAKT